MNSEKSKKIILILAIIFSVVLFDQVTKIIVRHNVEYNTFRPVVDHIVTLTKVENTGAFLSLGDHLSKSAYNAIMILIPVLVLGYALYYMLKHEYNSKSLTAGISLIIGGGFGNLIDRISFGSVTDFLHFNFGLFQTGIVNVADMSITAGFIILLLNAFLSRKEEETTKQ